MSALPKQLELFGALDEASLYHLPHSAAYFALLWRPYGQGPNQHCYPLWQMPYILPRLDPSRDTWLSQAEFIRPNRRVVNLARISLLFADLDTHKVPWLAGQTPQQQVAALLYHCQQEGIPEPSLVVYSGRGLQAKWLLDHPLPRRALPRWNACQRILIDRLACLGADPQARDASRVLRVVQTVNSKSGEICRVVHVSERDGQPRQYGFEYLAEVLLPAARWTIEQQRRQRQQLELIHGKKLDGLRVFSGRRLAWDRLEDLRKLAELRGGVHEGERMQHLFWRLNFLLLSGATHSSRMYHEAVALAAELDPSWGYSSRELMTLYEKAKAYEAGQRVEFGGKQYPPLYTPKNETLISLFQITSEEQRQLKTIISSDIAKERDRERDTKRRRDKGAIDRVTYEAKSLSRTKPWEAMGISRASWYRAGKPMPPYSASACGR